MELNSNGRRGTNVGDGVDPSDELLCRLSKNSAANDLSPKLEDLTLSLISNDKLIDMEVSSTNGKSSIKALYSGISFLILLSESSS